jgi:glycosyltransferase involved in cell wall biosynthesis
MDAREAIVAWVTPMLGRNGNLLYMGPLLKGISAAYKQFQVFTVEFGGDSNSAGFDITCSGSIKRINQGVTREGAPTAIPLISPAIVKKLHRYRPDLLILNEFSMLTIYCMLLTLVMRRTKVLLIVENRPIITASVLSRGIRKYLRLLIARHVDAILTNNINGRSYLIEELGVETSRIVCRPYLISDMSQYIKTVETGVIRHKIHDKNELIHFLYVGRLIQSKGLHHALDAFRHLMEKHSGKFRFDMVGDGPYRSVLEDQVRRLGLQDHVCFHGQQPYDSLAELYRGADVFLFPTLMDYRSLVCFEAMSAGLPILASIHDGGSVETVREGENGFTFDPLDHRNLFELMSCFIEQPELIGQFSAKSKEISAAYTLPRAIEAVVIASNLALAGVRP